jgi:hypothetical protein
VPALNLDAIFEQVLNSADVGMRKRNPPFFRNWLEQYEVEPNEAFLLDHRVGAYRRSGMALWPVVHPSLLAHVLGEVSKFVDDELPPWLTLLFYLDDPLHLFRAARHFYGVRRDGVLELPQPLQSHIPGGGGRW